jgi:hypothetical protein
MLLKGAQQVSILSVRLTRLERIVGKHKIYLAVNAITKNDARSVKYT